MFKRIKLPRLCRVGVRLFQAGIKPHVMYGSELTHPTAKGTVARSMAKQLGSRPFALPMDLRWAAGDVRRDLEFDFVAKPLLRWCRKIWMTGQGEGKHLDMLGCRELADLLHELVRAESLGQGVPDGELKAMVPQAALLVLVGPGSPTTASQLTSTSLPPARSSASSPPPGGGFYGVGPQLNDGGTLIRRSVGRATRKS